MAYDLLASNVSAIAGKWRPYYYKNFYLGTTTLGSSEDGTTYISQLSGTSDNALEVWVNDSHNCAYYYVLNFYSSAKFIVKKYDENDKEINVLVASDTTGNGLYWAFPISPENPITIDIGVYVSMNTASGTYDMGDKYKIKLPTFDQMERKKIYHGGYSTFIRTPYTEGIAFHSDIIPTSLEGKNITCIFNPVFNSKSGSDFNPAATIGRSVEDITGNSGISLSLEWNSNPDGVHTNAAGTTSFGWDLTGETWMLGTVFVADADATNISDVGQGIIAQAPSSDSNSLIDTTGDGSQIAHISVSGRMGYAALRCEFWAGAGSSKIHAYNQFWHVILIIK